MNRPALLSAAPGSLAAGSVSSVLWGGTGSVLKLLLQTTAQITLARILGPEQYGLFAIGAIVFGASAFLADIGLAYGLIQRQQLEASHVRFVFTWQLLLGAAVAAGLAALAAPLAGFFREPRAQDIILALAPLCLVQAMTAVSLNLLKRAMDFRAIALAGLLAYCAGYVAVGIPLALAGYQVWALVAAWAVQVCMTLVLLYACSRHALRPLLRHPDAADMTRFGLAVLATNLTNWFIGNIDRVVAARLFPSAALGLYATPYNLMNTPTANLIGALQPVMYSACARLQGEAARIRAAYLGLLGAIALLAMPAFVAVAAVADSLILALYGPAWREAAAVLRPIALAMPFYLALNMSTPVLWTRGRIGAEVRLQLPLALLWLPGAILAAGHSLAALAWTVPALFLLRALLVCRAAAKAAGIPARELLRAVLPGAILSLGVAGCAMLVDAALGAAVESPALRLAAVVLACILVGLAGLRPLRSLIEPPLAQLLRQLVNRLPARLSAAASGLAFGSKSA